MICEQFHHPDSLRDSGQGDIAPAWVDATGRAARGLPAAAKQMISVAGKAIPILPIRLAQACAPSTMRCLHITIRYGHLFM
jgi:hypothetical protein